MQPMRILTVASEAVPFAKTGGLADVIGALPFALSRLGHDVDVVMPRYRGISDGEQSGRVTVRLGGQVSDAGIWLACRERVRMVFVDQPAFFTIHNLAYQGVFDASWLPRLGFGWDLMRIDALEYWGRISYLKSGLMFSRAITTVSPRYAREIQTPEYGFGFDGILRYRSS